MKGDLETLQSFKGFTSEWSSFPVKNIKHGFVWAPVTYALCCMYTTVYVRKLFLNFVCNTRACACNVRHVHVSWCMRLNFTLPFRSPNAITTAVCDHECVCGACDWKRTEDCFAVAIRQRLFLSAASAANGLQWTSTRPSDPWESQRLFSSQVVLLVMWPCSCECDYEFFRYSTLCVCTCTPPSRAAQCFQKA